MTASCDDDTGARRLPQSIEPPVDLWPAIAAQVAQGRERLGRLAASAPRDIEPPEDLWPAIAARLRTSAGPARSPPRQWLAAAASIAAVAVLVGLGTLHFSAATRAPELADEQVEEAPWRLADSAALPSSVRAALTDALEALHLDFRAVQNERTAVEQILADEPTNPELNALWQRLYRAELDLAARAESLIENFRGA